MASVTSGGKGKKRRRLSAEEIEDMSPDNVRATLRAAVEELEVYDEAEESGDPGRWTIISADLRKEGPTPRNPQGVETITWCCGRRESETGDPGLYYHVRLQDTPSYMWWYHDR